MIFPDCSDRRPADRAWARTAKRHARRTTLHLRALSTLVRALACVSLALPGAALAFDPFTVRDIQVEGVQRTEAGTVFSYLPIKDGERIDDQKVADAVKSLHATRFYPHHHI